MSSYDFHEQAEFLQLSVPVFGSTIYSVSCGNSDAVVKVERELVVLNRRIMFVFQRRYSFPTSYLCFGVFSITVSGSTIYCMSSNVFDVGVQVMSELLHCHAESFISSMTDARQVICASEGVGTLKEMSWGCLRVVKTSPSLATLLRLYGSPPCPPASYSLSKSEPKRSA